MNFAIIHTDETENELDIAICCLYCCSNNYNWTKATFDRVRSMTNSGTAITNVPLDIDTSEKLVRFISEMR